MKTLALTSVAAIIIAAAPANAMTLRPVTSAPAVENTMVETVNMRVSRSSRSAAQTSSSLLNLPLGLNLGNLLGVNARLGVMESSSSAYSSQNFSKQVSGPRGGYGHRGGSRRGGCGC